MVIRGLMTYWFKLMRVTKGRSSQSFLGAGVIAIIKIVKVACEARTIFAFLFSSGVLGMI